MQYLHVFIQISTFNLTDRAYGMHFIFETFFSGDCILADRSSGPVILGYLDRPSLNIRARWRHWSPRTSQNMGKLKTVATFFIYLFIVTSASRLCEWKHNSCLCLVYPQVQTDLCVTSACFMLSHSCI